MCQTQRAATERDRQDPDDFQLVKGFSEIILKLHESIIYFGLWKDIHKSVEMWMWELKKQKQNWNSSLLMFKKHLCKRFSDAIVKIFYEY